MTKHGNPPGIPLPAGWSQHARSAMLHIISLAQFALAYTRVHDQEINAVFVADVVKRADIRMRQL